MTMKKNKGAAGLYIHIPFCRRKCLYCDFCSYPDRDSATLQGYVERLCRELADRAPSLGQREIDTVYFGGGTPTLLPPAHFVHLLDTVRAHYTLAPDAEITTECNPATADEGKLSALRSLGINRLSIGMQSADDGELAALGRIHSAAQAKDTVREARKAGFDNVSLDIMYGIPTQTRDSFRRTLDAVLALEPEHISAYSLILEEGTPFFEVRDSLALPDEDAVCDMTAEALSILRGAGYERYEISNFAKSGYRSRHNLHYWNLDDYLGVGIAAHSLIGRVREQNRPDLAAYLGGKDIGEREELLDDRTLCDEYVMLRLRLADGVNKREFCTRFGASFDARYGEQVQKFARMGLMTDTPDAAAFTDQGFMVSNALLAELLF